MSTRSDILDAAADLACELGPSGITIAGVSERAGVTKGALFHYFRTKEELVAGLLEHVASGFDEQLDRRSNGASFSRVLVDLTLETVGQSSRLVSVLLAAVVLDRSLTSIVSQRTEAWHARLVEEGMPAGRARLLRAALDGVLLTVATGIASGAPGWLEELRGGMELLLRPSDEEALADTFRHALDRVEG